MFSRILPGIVLAMGGLISPSGADDLSGAWKMRISFGDRGGRTSILRLDTVGDDLTGVMLWSQGSRTAIENASFENGQLSFHIRRTWGGREFVSRYAGTFDNEQIAGTAQFEFRGQQRTRNWVATRTTSEPVTEAAAAPAAAADIELTDANYQAWRGHILPDSSEMGWEQIPWLTTFKDGILAANAANKPLLLWTMNGHPLGCT